MPRNSPKFSVPFEWILGVSFEWILWVSFEFSVSFELILNVSFELTLGIQGSVSEPKHIYCQNRLAACQAAYSKILQCCIYMIRKQTTKHCHWSQNIDLF